MSTRSQIEFRTGRKDNKGKVHTERRMVYRHSDGYPEGVIPDLKEFLKWNSGRNNDVEYQTANFIYWSKRKSEFDHLNMFRSGESKLDWNDEEVKEDGNSSLKLGFGVCENDNFHGDIEYFYEVSVALQKQHFSFDYREKITIKCYKVPQPFNGKRKEFKLIETVKVGEIKDA